MAHIPVSLEDSVKVLILIGSVDTDSNVKNVLTSVKAGLFSKLNVLAILLCIIQLSEQVQNFPQDNNKCKIFPS